MTSGQQMLDSILESTKHNMENAERELFTISDVIEESLRTYAFKGTEKELFQFEKPNKKMMIFTAIQPKHS